MNKIIIADAGPLIAFARLHQIGLLPQLFGRVLVTNIVFEEWLAEPIFLRVRLSKRLLARSNWSCAHRRIFLSFRKNLMPVKRVRLRWQLTLGAAFLWTIKPDE